MKKLYESLMNGDISLKEAAKAPVLKEVEAALIQQQELFKDNRTAQLWLQYEDMVKLILKLLKSERTANYGLGIKAKHEAIYPTWQLQAIITMLSH